MRFTILIGAVVAALAAVPPPRRPSPPRARRRPRATSPRVTDLVGVRRVWCGIEGSAEHSAALGADGALEVCNHPPDATVCVQNWNEEAEVLRSGWQTELYGFRCTSEAQGIRCTVLATGKGFLITLDGVTPV